MVRVCFVCLGNICRSPTAEGVFRELIRQNKLETRVKVESRGTGPWHVGEAPDPRSQACAKQNGVDISDLRGRQFSTYDFESFDYILTMDESNYNDVVRQARDDDDKIKVELLLSYSKKPYGKSVPDPYQGGLEGFQKVYEMIHHACSELLAHIKKNHG